MGREALERMGTGGQGPSDLLQHTRDARGIATIETLAIHWAETPAETEWMSHGRGDFEGLCLNSAQRPGLDVLAENGLLTSRTALIHGNEARPQELGRIAEAGATIVHCPGSHAFFGRPPFRPELFLDAGVEIALGTDSLASNESLDMRREMSILRQSAPQIPPREVWRMATESAAKAIGCADELGRIDVGLAFDAALYEIGAGQRAEEVFELLTATRPPVRSVWVAGQRRFHGNGEAARPSEGGIE